MKKCLIFLIISIMLVFSTSCQSLNKTDESIKNTNMKTGISDENFSILVPKDYVETSSKYISKYFVKDNSASIIVTNEPNSYGYDTVQKYYDNAISQYQSTFDSFEEISKENVTVSSKYSGQIVEFSYKILSQNDSIDMTCYVEYILSGNTIYVVTCSAPSNTYSNYKNDFINTVNSVTINQ